MSEKNKHDFETNQILSYKKINNNITFLVHNVHKKVLT